MEKYAKLALLVIQFLKELEELVDPNEKSIAEDKVLAFLEHLCGKMLDDTPMDT